MIRLVMEQLRKEIDDIDRKIIELLAKPFSIAKEIQPRTKKDQNLPIQDKEGRRSNSKAKVKPLNNRDMMTKKFTKEISPLIMKKSKEVQRKLAIIGGKRADGADVCRSFQRRQEYELILTGSKDNNTEAVKDADIVIISVPIRETNVIEEIAHHIKQDALLTDFTSVKTKPMEAMKKAKSLFLVGIHYLIQASALKVQNFILCPEKENRNSSGTGNSCNHWD